MTVPDYLVEFLKKKDAFGYLASLNDKQFCDVCRYSGVYVINKEFLKIIYMPSLSPELLNNLKSAPKMTVTIVSAYSLECYQLKGKHISHENLNAEDEKFKDTYLQGMTEVITDMGFKLEKVLKGKYNNLDTRAIIMKVEEIYEQTPKKGTGEKIKRELIN